MRKNKYLTALLCLLIISACNNKTPEQVTITKGYFNLGEILDNSIDKLVEDNATLEKLLITGEKKETIIVNPDSVDGWKRQLKLFYEADINKPGFSGAYFEEEMPTINGASKKIYTAKNKKHAVQVMECTYKDASLKEIRLLVKESNAIYDATKEMNLFFNGESTLISFNIDGGESMRLKKEMNYKIQATILR